MPQFAYIAINNQNKSTAGVFEGPDRMAVIDSLTRQGLRPVNIVESTNSKKRFSLKIFNSNKVKSDDIVMFTRQLSAMVGAGVPLLRALTSMSKHTTSTGLKKILEDVIRDVEGGAPLGEALESHPDTFSDVYINMVKAGEAAGILDAILNRLAVQQEKNATIRKKVKSAMTYPMVLMFITVLAFFACSVTDKKLSNNKWVATRPLAQRKLRSKHSGKQLQKAAMPVVTPDIKAVLVSMKCSATLVLFNSLLSVTLQAIKFKTNPFPKV
jgi:type IV pilus assembly protein PilC